MTYRKVPLNQNPLISAADLQRLHAQAFSWALTCVGNVRADAEDVLQMTYVAILEGHARFDGRSSLKTWLFAVIRTQAHSLWRNIRRQARKVAHLETASQAGEWGSGPHDALGRRDETEKIIAAWRSLPARQREVLDLVFYRDMSIADAAQIIGVSVGSARTHYQRAKAALRERIEAPVAAESIAK